MAHLLRLLSRQRCLLVLDNCESMLQAGARAGVYLPDYAPYGQLLRRLSSGEHQSCLLLTSREQLPGFHLLQAENERVASLQIGGLSAAACHELLLSHGLNVPPVGERILTEHYSGSPLALQIVAETVKEILPATWIPFCARRA
ncbi:MAG: hypothetical protein HC822_12815 [Oscillochloris sp.]|nr:hypothetical protein [Oscillochloris sp.]